MGRDGEVGPSDDQSSERGGVADGTRRAGFTRDPSARRLRRRTTSDRADPGRAPRRLDKPRSARAQPPGARRPPRSVPAGGFSVRQFTLADIWDAIEIRGALEGIAARLAAQRYRKPAEARPAAGALCRDGRPRCGQGRGVRPLSRDQPGVPCRAVAPGAQPDAVAQPRGDLGSPVRRAGGARIRRKGAGRGRAHPPRSRSSTIGRSSRRSRNGMGRGPKALHGNTPASPATT